MNHFAQFLDRLLAYFGLRPDPQAARASARLLHAIDDLNDQLRCNSQHRIDVHECDDREGTPSEQRH